MKTHILVALLALPLLTGCGSDDPESGVIELGPLDTPVLIVANGELGRLQVIDPESREVVASGNIEEGYYPHHLSVSHDRRFVLLTATGTDLSGGHGGGHGGGTDASSLVYRLDVTTGTMSHLLTLEGTVHNAAFLGDSDDFALTRSEHGALHVYDGETLEELWSVDVGTDPLEATPTHDGSTILVANSGDATVAVIDVATRSVTRVIPVGDTPVAAWLSGDGSLHVSNEGDGTVSELSTGLDGVTNTVDVDGVPGQAFVTPAGDKLWVAVEDRGVIGIYDAVTHEAVTGVFLGMKPHGIAFDPTGALAYVTNETSGKVHVINVAERHVATFILVGGAPNGIVYVDR
jgi:YVTN family beta-propeller protein